MKKKMIFASILLIAIILIGIYIFSRSRNNNIYGTYVVDSVVYLSPLSSGSKDLLKEQMKDTTIIFSKDEFMIEASEGKGDIKNPIYEKKEMDENIIDEFNESVFQSVSLSGYKDKYQYTIYESDKRKTIYRIYSLDNEIWVSTYGNTEDGNYYNMNIFKLKKK